jgi:V/A-type H+-transporting ATPase subunit A
VVCLSSQERLGALSVIGAVSPPGGDLSDPVVQATLKVVKVFWALDDRLANMRHFPAINWLQSYSLYSENIKDFLTARVAEDFPALRQEAMQLLEEEAELQEIARLVGVESLSLKERLILESSRSIREDFLHQNAYHPQDTYTSLRKQYLMLRTILHFHHRGLKALDDGRSLESILALKVRERIAQLKYFPEEETEGLEVYMEVDRAFQEIGDVSASKD